MGDGLPNFQMTSSGERSPFGQNSICPLMASYFDPDLTSWVHGWISHQEWEVQDCGRKTAKVQRSYGGFLKWGVSRNHPFIDGFSGINHPLLGTPGTPHLWKPASLTICRALPQPEVNPKGGAIALGHPLGATGARQIATLLPELKRQGKK